ncbi:conserved hypothetical protein [Vibrio chagasii]|nr:conserved hypothetical protein [Vibrio chagasii]
MKQLVITDYPMACKNLGEKAIEHFASKYDITENSIEIRHNLLMRIENWFVKSRSCVFDKMGKEELSEFATLAFISGVVTETQYEERLSMMDLLKVVKATYIP